MIDTALTAEQLNLLRSLARGFKLLRVMGKPRLVRADDIQRRGTPYLAPLPWQMVYGLEEAGLLRQHRRFREWKLTDAGRAAIA